MTLKELLHVVDDEIVVRVYAEQLVDACNYLDRKVWKIETFMNELLVYVEH